MADKKISQLTEATTLGADDFIPIVQSGVSKKAKKSLIADGSKMITGTIAPTAGVGNDGDHYIDKTSKTLYGPKTGGAWGTGTVLGGGGDPGYKAINAADFGFLPTKTAAENVTALNDALNGGNKRVEVTVPGDYKLNSTAWLYSNTEIRCGAGVYFSKDADYWNMFCNVGALTRTWDTGIRLIGFKLKMNGHEAVPHADNVLYGMRGSINLFYVENYLISDFECMDIGVANWPIHICTHKNGIVEKIRGEGMKDLIHMGKGEGFVVRDVVSSCYDDSVALNAFDYPEANPEIGTIKNGMVENIIYTNNPSWGSGGRVLNTYVGRVGAWTSGMMIMRGDAVSHNGKTYRALVEAETASTTAPSATSFTELQTTPEGIIWKLSENNVVTEVDVLDVTYKKLIHNTGALAGTLFSVLSGTDGTFCRSVHPSIPVANYPTCRVILDDFKSPNGRVYVVNSKCGVDILMQNNNIDCGLGIIYSATTEKKSFWRLVNNNMLKIAGGMNFGNNAEITFSRNLQNAAFNIGGYLSGCRVVSDNKIDIVKPSDIVGLVPKNGDHIVCSAGENYMFWGEWVWVGIWASGTRYGTVKQIAAVTASMPASVTMTAPNAATVYTQTEIQKMVNDISTIYTNYNTLISHYTELRAKMQLAGMGS